MQQNYDGSGQQNIAQQVGTGNKRRGRVIVFDALGKLTPTYAAGTFAGAKGVSGVGDLSFVRDAFSDTLYQEAITKDSTDDVVYSTFMLKAAIDSDLMGAFRSNTDLSKDSIEHIIEDYREFIKQDSQLNDPRKKAVVSALDQGADALYETLWPTDADVEAPRYPSNAHFAVPQYDKTAQEKASAFRKQDNKTGQYDVSTAPAWTQALTLISADHEFVHTAQAQDIQKHTGLDESPTPLMGDSRFRNLYAGEVMNRAFPMYLQGVNPDLLPGKIKTNTGI